jgi:hypothetical protein
MVMVYSKWSINVPYLKKILPFSELENIKSVGFSFCRWLFIFPQRREVSLSRSGSLIPP